ncbi:hypothetical protein NHG24_08725 [Aerococcaceae bacterium NML210727]|nr:hypothetical protein [Aerococcaceae bacterium NML210727]MCW6655357.1 hypothetical protein [Aerococcaceae bacterium NML201296]
MKKITFISFIIGLVLFANHEANKITPQFLQRNQWTIPETSVEATFEFHENTVDIDIDVEDVYLAMKHDADDTNFLTDAILKQMLRQLLPQTATYTLHNNVLELTGIDTLNQPLMLTFSLKKSGADLLLTLIPNEEQSAKIAMYFDGETTEAAFYLSPK